MTIQTYLAHYDKILSFFYAIILIVVGFFVANWLSLLAEKGLNKRFSRHQTLLVKRIIFYFIFIIFAVTGLQYLGFNLSILLGAAGVFTLALSFAAQTAVSNLISGIFLLFERPFKVGDAVEIKGTGGIVDSIDLLSTKLKTPDNKLIRIPNEAMIKSEITNLSYFTTRRIDINLAVAYNADLSKVKNILMDIILKTEHVLKNPAPTITVNINNAAIEMIVQAWVKTSQFAQIKGEIQDKIDSQLKKEMVDSSQVIVHYI